MHPTLDRVAWKALDLTAAVLRWRIPRLLVWHASHIARWQEWCDEALGLELERVCRRFDDGGQLIPCADPRPLQRERFLAYR